MKAKHFAWLIAYPVYQIIGTARHELSHAAAAVPQGAHITQVQILPSHLAGRGWYWGYIRFTGGTNGWAVPAAPYLCDLITFALAAMIFRRFPGLPDWAKANLFILGILSPWLNMAYNYRKVFFGSNGGDVVELMCALEPVSVNLVFIAALIAMGAWAVAVFRTRLRG